MICGLLAGIISAKPVENEADYRQFQNSGGSSYSAPILSGGYGVTQGTYSGYPVGYAMAPPMQPAPMNSYLNPFGFQGFGGGFGMPGYGGFPNFFG